MLTAAGSPLVAGSVVSVNTMTKFIKVIRSFMWNRKPTKVGDVLEVPALLAAEVVHSRKAEYVTEKQPEPAPVAAPAEPESAPTRRGRNSNAG